MIWKKSAAPNAENTTRARAEPRSEEHTSELQSLRHIVCRLLLEKKKLFAFTLRVRAGNTEGLTDAEENMRQQLRSEGVRYYPKGNNIQALPLFAHRPG